MSLRNQLLDTANILGRKPIPSPSPEIQEPAYKTCNVCALTMGSVHYPSSAFLPSPCSTHCSDICKNCISQSLAADIETKAIDHLGCPLCDQPWDRSIIEIFTTHKALEQYDSKKAIKFSETMPDFRRCQSPTCSGGQLHDGGDNEPIVTCLECGFRSCYTHRVAWHAGKSCAEYEAQMHQDNEAQKAVRLAKEENKYHGAYGKESKPCPHCKALIWRDGGFSAITCTYLYIYTIWAPYIPRLT